MSVVFDAQNLKHLRKIVKKAVGLELNDDELYDCAVSVVRLTCAKLLRSREISFQEEDNARVK